MTKRPIKRIDLQHPSSWQSALQLIVLILILTYFFIPYRIPALGFTLHTVILMIGLGVWMIGWVTWNLTVRWQSVDKTSIMIAILYVLSLFISVAVNFHKGALVALRGYTLAVCTFLLCYFFMSNFIKNNLVKLLSSYLIVATLLGVAQVFISDAFYLSPLLGQKIIGAYGNGFAFLSNQNGFFFAWMVPVLVFGPPAWKARWYRWMEPLIFLFVSFGLYLTFSRGAWLGVAVGLLGGMAYSLLRNLKPREALRRGGLYLASFMVVFLLMPRIVVTVAPYERSVRRLSRLLKAVGIKGMMGTKPMLSAIAANNKVNRTMLRSVGSRLGIDDVENVISQGKLEEKLEGLKLMPQPRKWWGSVTKKMGASNVNRAEIDFAARTKIYANNVLLKSILEHPIWGTGLGTFEGYYKRHRATLNEHEKRGLDHRETFPPHNSFLGLWAEAGIFPLVLFTCLVLQLLRKAIVSAKTLETPEAHGLLLGLTMGLVAVLVDAFFHDFLGMRLIWIAMALLSTFFVTRTQEGEPLIRSGQK